MIPVRWGAATDVGRIRRHNEDAVYAQEPVFVVADGMGGHAAGGLASSIIVQHFASLAGRRDVEPREIGRLISRANEHILEAIQQSPHRKGMGSTLVGLVLVTETEQDYAVVFNVGDSRVYRFGTGSLEQITVDHSYVQELVDAGRLGPGEAIGHPERNVVTRAMGSMAPPQADYWLFTPERGERYLLCSDGLTTEVDPARIAEILRELPDPEAAARALVDAAVALGGRDNVSAVVIDVIAGSAVTGEDRRDDTAPRVESVSGPPSVRRKATRSE